MAVRTEKMGSVMAEAWSRLRPFERRLFVLAAAGCLIGLIAMIWNTGPALRAWLAAAVLWTGIPIGSLAILMMIRIIPGEWTVELTVPMEAAILLLPLAAIVFLPILFGVSALYPWIGQDHETTFRSLYLSEWFFVLRTILWFGVLAALAYLLLAHRPWSTPVSCLGLIVFTTAGTVIATDWLMSLDPEFSSSGFGLYVMSIQMTVAMAAGVISALTASRSGVRKPQTLGGLLLTALLLWAYLSFMQFVIIWSGDFPQEVSWYLHRSAGAWLVVLWAIAILHAVPIILLMLPPILRSHRALVALAAAVLVGKVLETAWLVLPAQGSEVGWTGSLLYADAVLGIGALFAAAFLWAHGARVAARAPETSGREAGHG